MARIRQVFPRETVAHYWAHGVQDSARDAADTFYFNGPTLYSYGSHFAIAHILKGNEYGELNGRVIWNDATYSNTTSKMQWIVLRALTQQQQDKRLRVPNLNQDDARAIDRAIVEKRLPDYADKLVRIVQEKIADLIGKKHGRGPFCSLLHDARKYDETARALYAAAKQKYPLDAIPDNADIPADKAGRAEFVAKFSRAIVIADYKHALQRATQAYCTARDAETSDTGMQYRDQWSKRQVINGTYDIAQRGLRACDDADKHYQTLHARKSAQVAKIRKSLGPIAERFLKARDAADKDVSRDELQRFAERYYSVMRARKFSDKRARFDLPGYVGKARDALRFVGMAEDSTIGIAVNRAQRIDDARITDTAAKNLRDAFKSAESYGEQWPNDALRLYREVSETYPRQMRGRYGEFIRASLAPMIETAKTRADEMRAAVLAKNAQRLVDWINGKSNIRPDYAAGTFARIRGDVVETTRGASVPIAHACRLARVYDRIVNVGGKAWADGAGPMIGHYRVNRIGADGSLIIGCHEFDPTEARRLRDVMASCDACKSVSETDSE